MTHEDDDVRGLVDRVFQPVPRHGFERRVLGALSRASRATSGVPGPGRRRPRRWPARATLAGAAVAVVAAVAAAGLFVPASPFRQAHDTAGAATNVPSMQTINARLLAAREAHHDDFLHQTARWTVNGKETFPYHADYWIWPATEQPGAEVHARVLIAAQSDMEEIYVAPADLNAKSGIVTGELINVDFASRTWSDQESTTFSPVGSAAVVDYRFGIDAGYFHVVGMVKVNDHRTIQLQRVKNGQVLTFQSIYIDADTYLPIRQVSDDGKGTVLEYDLEYLRPTDQNLSKLRPVIPPGFTRTAAPPPPPHGTR